MQTCFFRQFFGSVTKVDYLTLRHGFIMVSNHCLMLKVIIILLVLTQRRFTIILFIQNLFFFFLIIEWVQAHLPAGSEARFDFQKYIQRSLEEDFKAVVGIRLVPFLF